MPDIGDYSDVPVIELLVKVGDRVQVEDPLLTLESDKAAMEVPSPVAGKVVEVLVDIGAKLSQGDAIAVIEAATAQAPAEASPAKLAEAIAPMPSPQPPVPPVAQQRPVPAKAADSNAAGAAHASPSVRAFARELGIDLSQISPTGPKGRILREDVQAWAKDRIQGLASGRGAGSGAFDDLPDWPNVDHEKFGPVSLVERTRIQTLSAGNLHRNWLSIPHVTNFDRADITELEVFRKRINGEATAGQTKLTMVAFLIKASATALVRYPRFNTSLDDHELIQKNYVHVGFAADTPAGLMVPVVRDANVKGILEIAADVARLASKAREGKLSGGDMQGGCFTVSSLGGVGGDGFTPIINAPEVAILGAGRSSIEPVWDGAAFQPRDVLPVSLSWDHRVIDGVAAARFLGEIANVLGDFRRAVL